MTQAEINGCSNVSLIYWVNRTNMNKNLSIFISALVLILALLLIFSHLISSSKTLIVVESAHRSVSSLEVIGSNSDLNEKYIFEIINCLQKLSFVNQTAFHSKDFQLFIESLVRGKYYKMTKEFSVDTSHIWIDVALIETN